MRKLGKNTNKKNLESHEKQTKRNDEAQAIRVCIKRRRFIRQS